MSQPTNDFFNAEAARSYDDRNSKLAPISDCIHFLIGLMLKGLPPVARVLCVGVGTGAEILSLARQFPQWSFVALEPSLSMLDVCRTRLKEAGLDSRCEFVHGYTQDVPPGENFDVALSVLVGHFVKREERADFYREITSRLKPAGHFVNAEISFDLDSAAYPDMLKGWEGVQSYMGATPEKLQMLPQVLREMLTVLPPAETETLLRGSGIAEPVRFFQALMICAWHGRKG